MHKLFLVTSTLAAVVASACDRPPSAVPSPVASASARAVTQPPQIRLETSPRRVYKENDAKDGHGKTESFAFRLVVRSSDPPALSPRGATAELRSGATVVESIRYSADALAAVVGHGSRWSVDFDASYELRFEFREPVALSVDAVSLTLDTAVAQASSIVPVETYAQKTKLLFPLKGDFMVVTGHVTSPGGHEERSQSFAYDVVGLGPHLELLRGDGTKNEDFIGYGREVLAPARGVVIYARNDVPDNPASGNQDMDALLRLPDPPWGIAGNCVVIDHGDGEYSLLAHMQPGSVRVKRADRVEPGEVLGRLGNSGATTGPHLHYHLMAGPEILRSDGLPARFENTCTPVPKPGQFCDTH
jgi:murein DD-endopeptidase MepM/ murein hydrolase activator NlpD